jgi:hypothetical protein
MSKGPPTEDHLALPYAGTGLRVFSAILDLIILASIFLLYMAASGFYLLTQPNWRTETTYTNSEGYSALAIIGLYAFVAPHTSLSSGGGPGRPSARWRFA